MFIDAIQKLDNENNSDSSDTLYAITHAYRFVATTTNVFHPNKNHKRNKVSEVYQNLLLV